MSEHAAANVSLTPVAQDLAARENFVQVRGQVRMPGEYLYRPGADLRYYVEKAGGPVNATDISNLIICREQDSENKVLLYQIDKLDIMPRIRGGDVLIFRSVAETDQVFRAPPPAPLLDGGPEFSVCPRRTLDTYIDQAGFKRLFDQLWRTQSAAAVKTLAVLSFLPGEGRSFLAAALAHAYTSFLNARVLVVETSQSGCSLLVPRDERCSEEPGDNGLDARYLTGTIDCLRFDAFDYAPGEGREFRLRAALKSVASHYDVVLLDTAPLRGAAEPALDPVVVTGQVDAAVMLVSPASSGREFLNAMRAEFAPYQLKVLGTIFNRRSAA